MWWSIATWSRFCAILSRHEIAKGMTLEQVKAANPTKGYRKQFGSDSGPWTTNMFVEAIYKSLPETSPKK